MEGRNGEVIKNRAVKSGQKAARWKRWWEGKKGSHQVKKQVGGDTVLKVRVLKACESLAVSAAGLMNLRPGHKLQRETSNVEMFNLGHISRLHANGDQLHWKTFCKPINLSTTVLSRLEMLKFEMSLSKELLNWRQSYNPTTQCKIAVANWRINVLAKILYLFINKVTWS